MDKFCEIMVEKERKGSTLLKIILIYAAGLIVAAILVFVGISFLSPFLGIILMAVVAVLFGTWVLSTRLFIEFEYIVTNRDIDIDKIVARKNRKRIITITASTIIEGGKFHPDKFKNTANFQKVIHVEKNVESAYYFVCKHQTFGKTLVVFSPNKKMIDALKPFLSREIYYAFDSIQ
ncbi:MAG: DUF6106 family protein [Clostridia bacterium]